MSRALAIRSFEYAGYALGDKIVFIAGSALIPKKMDLMKKLTFKANRTLACSSYNLDDYKSQ